jgi:hypothetical protein
MHQPEAQEVPRAARSMAPAGNQIWNGIFMLGVLEIIYLYLVLMVGRLL